MESTLYDTVTDEDATSVTSVEQTREREQPRKRGHIIKKLAIGALLGFNLTAGPAVAYIDHDIEIGTERVADSRPSVHTIYETQDPTKAQTATFVATGLGTRDSSETAEKLTSHKEIGDVFAIEYSNKDINIDALTETVVDAARNHGVKYLYFDGYSAGGPIELAVAADIYEKYDDLQVLGVALNSSPIGNDSLTDKSEEAGKILSTVLNRWPKLAYSEKARWVAEVLARHDRYYDSKTHDLNFDELKHEIDDVYDEKIRDQDVASGSLISSQYNAIFRYTADKSIGRLAKHHDNKIQPMIYYVLAQDPGNDNVVDVEQSKQNIIDIAKKYSIPLEVIGVAHIGHANPGERPTEYNAMISAKINPLLESALRVYFSVGGKPERSEPVYALSPRNEVILAESGGTN